MSKVDKALTLFDRFNCAQSVFAGCGPYEGVSEQMCLTVAGPFGAGMGRQGETCGAVTGALMVLGARYGQAMTTDPAQARGPLYERVRTFMDAFLKQNGSLLCRELTGCNLCTITGQEEFKTRDLHHTLCRNLVAGAVELLEQE
jgi:C_GCAxxG_C_C family probable redox protein